MPSALTFRKTAMLVAALNLIYFVLEFGVALRIGSVSLFADSIDFLEDASVNLLVAAAVNWRPDRRARVGMLLAGVILIPSIAALWQAWHKLLLPLPPAATPLSLVGAGALVVNFSCAMLLARFQFHHGSLTRGAFLSARNDAIANVAIILAGFVTAYTRSGWPDLTVGLGIVALNARAAVEVWNAARQEHKQASCS